MKITITWWDGSVITATDWEAAERELRAAQWTKYPDRAAFRRDMRHRAKTWTGTRPALVHLTSEAFLRALEANSMCRVDTEEES